MPFTFERLDIPDVILISPKSFKDDRGYFMETYKHSDFVSAGIRETFVQDNFSKSSEGVLRGLHYQKHPSGQGKLVQCISGKIFDVAVDIRRGSPFFGKWVGMELSSDNNYMLYIPEGFAHGFVVVSKMADVMYKCTGEYAPADDRGLIWNDPSIGIRWPVKEPVLSGKDSEHPLLKNADNNFKYKAVS